MSFKSYILSGVSAVLSLTAVVPAISHAEIRFEEVTETGGIEHTGPTYGLAWGDFNGDGYADVWVGNHWESPSLYLNRGDGTFEDIASQVLPPDLPDADAHGAAWADFDNDGDQDLIETAGAFFGEGTDANRMFVNEGGRLRERSASLGLSYPSGRGRNPLWADIDSDGKLDLLFVNSPRNDGKAPTAIFYQTKSGFQKSSEGPVFGALGVTERTIEKAASFLSKRYDVEAGWPPRIIGSPLGFLSDLSGDGKPDLVILSSSNIHSPSHLEVYSTLDRHIDETTDDIGLPRVTQVRDVAAADFNGDLLTDMYLVRQGPWGSSYVERDNNEVAARLMGSRDAGPVELTFQTLGDVTFTFGIIRDHKRENKFLEVEEVVLGSGQRATGQSVTIKAGERATIRMPEHRNQTSVPVRVGYDAGSQRWVIRHVVTEVNLVLRSSEPIDDIRLTGTEMAGKNLPDVLLMRQPQGFDVRELAGDAGVASGCASVATGDYDNDMDLDLYLVCAAPAGNTPNIVLENDGNGHFTLVPNAGGASGSAFGIGDSVAIADYDNDGFLDLFITNGTGNPPLSQGPHQLYHNSGNSNHWLEIDLEGTVSNRDGIGAIVIAKTGDKAQMRQNSGGVHRHAQDHKRIHFGLAGHDAVDVITVIWPSGTVQCLKEIPANQILKFTEITTEESGTDTGQCKPDDNPIFPTFLKT